MVKSKCARSARCKLLGCLLLLLAVRTVGRKCENDDVFPKGHFSTATIPANCTELSLRSNKIGDDGATALAEVLKNNTALATLNLHGNKIGDDGATALAEALKNNNTALATLSLSNNKIGNDGAIALAEALKTSTALTYLALDRNMIGRRGELALQDMLESNTALKPRHLPGSQRYTAGQQIGIVATTVASLLMFAAYYNYLGHIKPYLTKRRTYRAFGCAHSIIISTLAGDTYTLTDWGLCKDLKVALCKLVPADAIGKPDTFQLLGDLNVASGNHNSSNQKMIDTKYGSDDRERMMQAKVVEGYNFEFALVYQGSGVGERRVGGGGDKGGIGGAATNVYDVTGNAPMRMVSSTAV